MKNKPTKFTDDEIVDIRERYGEWLKPENYGWVKEEFEKYVTGELSKQLDDYPFAKNYAEKQWIAEKLKDQSMHSSPYIESRIGDYKVSDFNDVTRQRILLEEMELGGVDGKGFLSEFIENRVKEMTFESFDEEMQTRQRLADCEMHTTSYVASRIGEYRFKDIDDEIFHRIKLEECEKLNSPFIRKRIDKYVGKIHPEIEHCNRNPKKSNTK